MAYTSFGVSGTRVALSGGQEGWGDLALDALGFSALKYAGTASGLYKTFWYGADIGVNAYQGYTGVTGGYDSYQQGSYGMAVLQGVGGLLGIAAAGYGTRGLGRMIAADATMNPFNYRLPTSGRSMTLGMNGAGFNLEFVAPGRVAALPWGNAGARQAAKAIESGEQSITVASRSEASEVVWRMFSARGFTNTTGRTGSDVRRILGSKAGTYHWDDAVDVAGRLAGHGADNVHGTLPHVQIHLENNDVIRIFFPR